MYPQISVVRVYFYFYIKFNLYLTENVDSLLVTTTAFIVFQVVIIILPLDNKLC